MKRDKVINYSSKTATNDTILNTIVNNSDVDKNLLAGEIAVVMTSDNEALYTLNHDKTALIEYKPYYKIKAYVDEQINDVKELFDFFSIYVDTTHSGTDAIITEGLNYGGYSMKKFLQKIRRCVIENVSSATTDEGVIPMANIKFLDDADGLLSTLSLAKVVSPATGMASQYQLVGKDGTTVLGVTIDIPKDQFLKSAEFIASATEADKSIDASVVIGDPYLKFVFQTTGTDTTTYISVKKLVDIYVAGNGINITSNTVSVKIDASGEAFLTVGTGGLKLSGVQTAINTAVTTEKNRAEGIENSLRTDVDSKVSGITTSDTSITVDNTTTTNPKLKVTLSQTDGNRLALNADGLYVTNTIDCGTF